MPIGADTMPITVVSQNVYHDVTRSKNGLVLPQDDRIGSIVATLGNFPHPLDVVGIQEAHRSQAQHNGEVLSQALGYGPGFWVHHNQKPYPDSPTGRTNEFVGLFGAEVEDATPIELGDNRRAALTVIANVAFVTLHLRSGEKAMFKRLEQARRLTKSLEAYENAVVFGDFNEITIKPAAFARNHLRKQGFRSVFERTGQSAPLTYPVDSYAAAAAKGRGVKGPIVKHGFSIDDIYVRGPRVNVLSAGVLERVVSNSADLEVAEGVPVEGSDHDGIYANLELS